MFNRSNNIKKPDKKIWLASPTMHGDEQRYVADAFEKNWVTTIGENIRECERVAVEYTGNTYSVGLSTGTAALHMSVKLAANRLYGTETGKGEAIGGALYGKKVFCSDVTFGATTNPVIYEGGEPIFIDSEYESWNMDPKALEKAFELYPEVKIVIVANLYGTPAKLDEIRKICDKNGALLIEDAAESLGARFNGKMTGSFGDYNAISFNGNKIITGSAGGMFLTDNASDAEKVKKWSTQAREDAPWYQHEEIGYNYRMSNIIAGIVRGQFEHIDEHIALKKKIYERYAEGFKDLQVSMNSWSEGAEPNYWLSCMIIDKEAMCAQERGDKKAEYKPEPKKSCPTEILETLSSFNIDGRPIWKPMHMQPVFSDNAFVSAVENGGKAKGCDIFERGLCLPSDIKMTEEEQDLVIEIVRRCFE